MTRVELQPRFGGCHLHANARFRAANACHLAQRSLRPAKTEIMVKPGIADQPRRSQIKARASHRGDLSCRDELVIDGQIMVGGDADFMATDIVAVVKAEATDFIFELSVSDIIAKPSS